MTELLVQKYLRSGKTLDDLFQEHGVKSYISNGKIGLNYSQLEAKGSDPLACECRGLILEEGSFNIIACPMFRFFNMEQKEVAAKIDWNTAGYYEKLDGSCVNVYNYKGKWQCATRGRPEADGNIDGGELKFSDLVDATIRFMRLGKNLHEAMERLTSSNSIVGLSERTLSFELTSPVNRIVCRYETYYMTLLAIKNNKTLKEESPELWAERLGGAFKTPKKYSFNNINHLIQVIKEWSPEEHEGIVVKDANYNRIKVKSPQYLAYNHLRDSLSTSLRGCVEVLLLGKDDDVIPMMPEIIARRITLLKPLVAEVFRRTEKDYAELKGINDMKTYALAVKDRLWPAALFALKRNKTPDLRTFSLGRMVGSKIPSNATANMLELCRQVDPATVDGLKSLVIEPEE